MKSLVHHSSDRIQFTEVAQKLTNILFARGQAFVARLSVLVLFANNPVLNRVKILEFDLQLVEKLSHLSPGIVAAEARLNYEVVDQAHVPKFLTIQSTKYRNI